MKNLKMLVWLTQLGLSVALPPLGFIWLAIRLQSRFGWGKWTLWTGIILGIICVVDGFKNCLKAMERMSNSNGKEEPPVSFNEHD